MVGVKVGRLFRELGGLIFEVGADEYRVEVGGATVAGLLVGYLTWLGLG